MWKTGLLRANQERCYLTKMTELNITKNLITSRQNATVKRVCSLLEKKARRAEGLFRFDGIKLLFEAAKKGLKIEYAVLSEKIDKRNLQRVEELIDGGFLDEKSIVFVTEQVFEKMSDESSPEGIITVAKIPVEMHGCVVCADEYFIDGRKRILIVESLRDPGNMGTVIRSSFALGIDRLIISDDCADLYNPKTVRAAMGALFSLEIDIVPRADLPKLILRLRSLGRAVYATALRDDALKIGEIDMKIGDAFVIGNEGHGLSDDVIDASTKTAISPMTEGSESLNAAAAAAVCIWETVRKGR